MGERAAVKRDVPRRVAWTCVAVVAAGFGLAGVVYDPDPEFGSLCGSASFALDMGALDFARAQLDRAELQDPDHPWLHLLRSRLAYAEHDPDRAERHLREVLRIEPDHPEAHLHLAFYAWERCDWESALDHYRKGGHALEKTPRQDVLAEYWLRLAELELAAGSPAAAHALGKRLIDQGLRPAAGELICAFSRLVQGDDRAYGRGLERAYSIDPFEPLFRQGPGPLARAFPWLPAR